jgi:hypothetical protein
MKQINTANQHTASIDTHIGPIEIKMPNGEYFFTEVCREGNKLITGTFSNAGLLRDRWEVNIDDYYSSLQESLDGLYDILFDYAHSSEALLEYA